MRVLREILYGVVLCGATAYGQWIDCTNGAANNKQCVSTGNVGLGTATPSSLLHLLTPAPSGTAYPTLTLGASGSLTVGRFLGPVTSGGEQLYLTKNLLFNPAVGWVSDSTSGNAGMIALDGSNWSYPIAFYVSAAGSNSRTLKSAMQIDTSANVVMNGGGNVSIGTSSAQYKLTVNGTIGAKEVIVTNGISADYVFKPGYRLRPLPEVAAFIKAHQHLPEVPSEKEVQENGISVGEMQAKLLAKIEELTLHMIEAHQQTQQILKENEELRQRISGIEAIRGNGSGLGNAGGR